MKEFLNGRVAVKVGDITKVKTDAIVNAANSSLLGGGGVDGAIHRAGGSKILEECRKIRQTEYPNGLPAGKAVITSGGNLMSKYVIHTVGPIYGNENGRESELLAECYKNCLNLAVENSLETVSFPAISTGVYHFPKDLAAEISSAVIKSFLAENDEIMKVQLVYFSEADAGIFLKHHTF